MGLEVSLGELSLILVVHFGLVENGVANWSYLGYLSNDRPSAIFRVSGLKSSKCGSRHMKKWT